MSVILIAAATICGRIGPISPGSGADRQFLEKMRDATGASLIGASTLRMSDPEIRGTGGILSPDRIKSVITGSGDIPTTSKKIFADRPAPIIFTIENHVSLLRDKLRDKAELIGLTEKLGRLSLKAVINELISITIMPQFMTDSAILQHGWNSTAKNGQQFNNGISQ